MAEDSTGQIVPPKYDVNAKWDACLDLTVRRFVYSSLAGAFSGLLFFSESPSLLFSFVCFQILYKRFNWRAVTGDLKDTCEMCVHIWNVCYALCIKLLVVQSRESCSATVNYFHVLNWVLFASIESFHEWAIRTLYLKRFVAEEAVFEGPAGQFISWNHHYRMSSL